MASCEHETTTTATATAQTPIGKTLELGQPIGTAFLAVRNSWLARLARLLA